MSSYRAQGKPNTKSRDIEVNVVDYSLHYFNEDSPSLFVPLPKGIDIDEVTSIKHKENPEMYNSINAKIKQANKQSGRPIRLILEKNGVNTRIHYQCKRNMLPSVPEHIAKKVSSKVKKILGCKIRLWKNLSSVGYRDGYLDENMVRWEEFNEKSTGKMEVTLSDGQKRISRFQIWKTGLLGRLQLNTLADFNREPSLASGGNMGHDLTLEERIKREYDLDKDVFKGTLEVW